MSFRRLAAPFAFALATATASARAANPMGCPYAATTDPAPFDRSDVIDDRVADSDPVQTSRLAIDPTSTAPTCTAPDAAPATTDVGLPFHYKEYAFRNYSGASACVSVTLYHASEGQPLQVAAYSSAFDPASVTANYLAAVHDDALSVYQFSFTVPANGDFVVVVNNSEPASETAGADSGAYQLLVGGCGEPGGVVDAGTPDMTGVTTDVSGTDPAPTTGASSSNGGQSATAATPNGKSNGSLPANESFGDCSATHGSPRDALFVALAIAFVSYRRRRRGRA